MTDYGLTHNQKLAIRVDGTAFPCACPAVRTKHRVARMLMGGLVAVMALFAGGCPSATTGGNRGGAFCDVSSPMVPEAEDVDRISLKLGRQVVAHNRYGGKACGWKP